MYPILARYGPFFLYSYTVVMGLGLAAAFALAFRQVRRKPCPGWADALLLSLWLGLPGGRLGFVIGQWSYFQDHLGEIWQIGQGGYSYHTALLTGMIALWWYSRRQRRPMGDYLGLFAPGLAMLAAFGWGACWLEGCAYGAAGSLPRLTANLPDSYGVFAVRYQTQLFGMVASLMVSLWGVRQQQKREPVQLFWLTLFCLSASRAVISLFRGDAALQLGTLRADAILDTILALSSLILLQYLREDTVQQQDP